MESVVWSWAFPMIWIVLTSWLLHCEWESRPRQPNLMHNFTVCTAMGLRRVVSLTQLANHGHALHLARAASMWRRDWLCAIVVTRDTLIRTKTRGVHCWSTADTSPALFKQEDFAVYVFCCSEARHYLGSEIRSWMWSWRLFNCMNLCNTILHEMDGFQDKQEINDEFRLSYGSEVQQLNGQSELHPPVQRPLPQLREINNNNACELEVYSSTHVSCW